MEYYFQLTINTILSTSNLPVIETDEIKNLETDKETYDNYNEHPDYYYCNNFKVKRLSDEDIEKKEEEKKEAHIQTLTCTKRVLVLMLEELGVDYFEQILPLIEANRQAKLEWELCVELARSNSLIDTIGNQLGISKEQIDRLFLYANGEVDTLEVEDDNI